MDPFGSGWHWKIVSPRFDADGASSAGDWQPTPGLRMPGTGVMSGMSIRGERLEAKQIHCSVCKHPVSLQAGRGQRRAALIEDGLTLCDVCAPSGNQQPIRFEV
jgi:hypothetical protein